MHTQRIAGTSATRELIKPIIVGLQSRRPSTRYVGYSISEQGGLKLLTHEMDGVPRNISVVYSDEAGIDALIGNTTGNMIITLRNWGINIADATQKVRAFLQMVQPEKLSKANAINGITLQGNRSSQHFSIDGRLVHVGVDSSDVVQVHECWPEYMTL